VRKNSIMDNYLYNFNWNRIAKLSRIGNKTESQKEEEKVRINIQNSIPSNPTPEDKKLREFIVEVSEHYGVKIPNSKKSY